MQSIFAALNQTSHLTFGRETAQFKQLIELMTAVSIALWLLVALSLILRFVLCHVWYRRKYQPSNDNLSSQ